MIGNPKVYLAGPEVFLPDAAEIGRCKKALCERYNCIGLYPRMIRSADFGIANLTPFRGPSDVGTVFELGMLLGLGKPVLRLRPAVQPRQRVGSPISGQKPFNYRLFGFASQTVVRFICAAGRIYERTRIECEPEGRLRFVM